MIVKVVVEEDQMSIFDTENWRIYHSCEKKDIAFARELNKVTPCFNKAGDQINKNGEVHYYNAKWNKGIVAITKRATGYYF